MRGIIKRRNGKGTTGYSMNAFVDYRDPIDILAHLMIGSEGTLGFISNITYNTVNEYQYKASSFMLFPNIHMACEVASMLKESMKVDAAELMDRPSLRSAQLQSLRDKKKNKMMMRNENKDQMAFLNNIGDDDVTTSALLVEIRGASDQILRQKISDVIHLIHRNPLITPLSPIHFTTDPSLFRHYWDVRKGSSLYFFFFFIFYLLFK